MLASTFDIFKLGLGPSSSHTNGPMIAARRFRSLINDCFESGAPDWHEKLLSFKCTLYGSLAYTGLGHGTDVAIMLGLNNYLPEGAAQLFDRSIYEKTVKTLKASQSIVLNEQRRVSFNTDEDIIYDVSRNPFGHPNAIKFSLVADAESESVTVLFSQVYFSVGGGTVIAEEDYKEYQNAAGAAPAKNAPYVFCNSRELISISAKTGLDLAEIQYQNELVLRAELDVKERLAMIKRQMFQSIKRGLTSDGVLPGVLAVKRRAMAIYKSLKASGEESVNEYLCAYAMAVNEENASARPVVTAPTNGAAGVVPAVLYYLVVHKRITDRQVNQFLLTAAVIGSLIKSASSISGAEVGCQGEVGAASAMAAAGCCAVLGGRPAQVENAAEIALEHHLGMTCDPVEGLVQVPCIERNGFGAIKAYTAATLSLHGDGKHLISLDSCIAAMKQTGDEMSTKFKETSQGGLAVKWVDC